MSTANPKAVPDRLQGHTSDIDQLTLRGGGSVVAALGAGLQPTPTMKRTIGGGSTISMEVEDEELGLLDAALLSEDWQAELDGLDFAYLGTKKAGTVFSVGLEESAIAALRELKGPKKVQARRGQPDEVTRAEFVISLIDEVRPKIPYFCPQLHERQPIKTRTQGDAAKADAKANRDRGIGDVDGLKVKGEDATAAQVDVGDRALRASASHSAPREVEIAMIEALAVESQLGKLSRNYMQMTPSTAAASEYSPTSLEEACAGFLLGYVDGHEGAIEWFEKHPGAEPHEIAQAVQRSGAGAATNGAGNYGVWEREAAEWVDAFSGGEAGAGEEVSTEAFYFEVAKDENYWEAIKRLAKDVNWRAFFVAGRFFFIDELELARGMVRLAIDRDEGSPTPSTPGVEDVDFDFNRNKPITTVTITAYAKDWAVPPGGVVTIAGYGPASVGFGDPPPRRGQGQARGISANRPAAAKPRGRYLVVSVEGELEGDADVRLLTIKARKPTAPLPEPANETTSAGSEGGSDAANATVQRVLDFCEREAERAPPYVWGGYSEDGYDCSGFVSKALNVGGWLEGRLDTSGLAAWGEAGEGQHVTVHDNNGTGNPRTEHVIIEVEGRFFESGGSSGGVGELHPSAGDLAGFPTKRHPKGF